MSISRQLENYFKACFPALAIKTNEEPRINEDIIFAARRSDRQVVFWSCFEGYREIDGNKVHDAYKTLHAALNPAMWKKFENSVIVFRDIHNWPIDRDPILARGLKEMMIWGPDNGTTLVFVGKKFVSNDSFQDMVTVMDYSLPEKDALKKICENILKGSLPKDEKGQSPNTLPPELKQTITPELVDALSGLTLAEAENALALSYVESDRFDPTVIYREKVQAVRRNGYLELIESNPQGLDAIGGLDELKKYIQKRRAAYTKEAMEFGLRNPKGVLMVGVPGSGKSLAAKSIGTALGIPTLKLDVGLLFDKYVGESESRTRQVLAMAEAMAPCVLWIDEIDKGLAGAGGSGDSGGGVTKRVFGSIISWMQDKKRPVYVVATANQVTGLPPELLRKGRFDEIFAVDLPNKKERKEIFRIHLEKINRKSLMKDVDSLALATDGFTGAEIETVIDEAMFNAFDEKREITADDLISAAKGTSPLSKTAKEKVDDIRTWAKNRARFASTQDEASETKERTRKISSRKIGQGA